MKIITSLSRYIELSGKVSLELYKVVRTIFFNKIKTKEFVSWRVELDRKQ